MLKKFLVILLCIENSVAGEVRWEINLRNFKQTQIAL